MIRAFSLKMTDEGSGAVVWYRGDYIARAEKQLIDKKCL